LGYSRIIAEKFSINPSIGFGRKHFYTNYRDERFTDGGYSLIRQSKNKASIGLNIGYFVAKQIETFLGFHSQKKVNFGIRFAI
jgi:hypothetical protein